MLRMTRPVSRNLFFCLALCLATAVAAQPNAQPVSSLGPPPAAEIEAMQKACDGAIRGYSIDAPIDHLLPTHGVYAEGFGAVFITDVNLIFLSPLWGFGGHIAPGEMKRIHDSKLKRLPAVRELMIQILLEASKSMPHLTSEESILLRFNFYYMNMEDRTGLPKSMTVQGKKKVLLDIAAAKAAGKVPAEGVSGMLRVRED